MLIRDLCLPESADSPTSSESTCESIATTPVEEIATSEQRTSKNGFIAPFPAGQYFRPPEMAYSFGYGGDGRFLPAISDLPRRLGPADNNFNIRTSQVSQMHGIQSTPVFGYTAFGALPDYERKWPPGGPPHRMPEQERQQYPKDPFDIALQMASQRCIMGRQNPFGWPPTDSQQHVFQQLLPKNPGTPKPAERKQAPPRKQPSKQKAPRKTTPKKAPSEKSKPPKKQVQKGKAKEQSSEVSPRLEKRPQEILQEGSPHELSETEDAPSGQRMSDEELVERYRQEASKKRPADDDSEDDEEEDDESRRLPANCGIGEHLYRHHIHIACDRCASTFPNRDELRDHLRQQTPCKVSVRKVAEDAGFGIETEKRLRSRKKLEGDSESDKWAHMFRILFPSYEGKPTPSPIVVDVEAAMFARDLVAAKLQEAGDSCTSLFATVHESIINALNMVTAVAEQQLRLSEGSADVDSGEALVSDETQALYESSMTKLAALAEEFEAAMVSLPSSAGEGRSKKRLRKEE
ncbi:hypothetical protein CMQ_5049 [Grosmannia clavigera kw1407]|uniref:C2H2-type domain-containing protein n=1 Tax=Grosmannia clavigera (strain kw1407 / UAMH 11150) TaxID=655863 RepID=F0XK84_GROCL|nr:uncharacterized protein CMQ_5049 [Grosmannia clavigera kw1407]EFX01978.1 hypothetical protein CMQ_5049 [Grosmannia clavigera kw1407]